MTELEPTEHRRGVSDDDVWARRRTEALVILACLLVALLAMLLEGAR